MRARLLRAVITLGVLTLAAGALPRRGLAQVQALALVAGAWSYDLSGTGTTGFGGLRLEMPVQRLVVIEPGLTYARYTSQGGQGVSYLIPEFQGQLQIPGRVVRPFLGAGLGLALVWAGLGSTADLALSSSAGVRVRLGDRWTGRAELRVRSIDPFHGSVAEWAFGFARRF
jgi:hypothetical protein